MAKRDRVITTFGKGRRTFELDNLKNDIKVSNDISSESPEKVKTIQSFMRESYTFSNDYNI